MVSLLLHCATNHVSILIKVSWGYVHAENVNFTFIACKT